MASIGICDDELPELENLGRLVEDYGREKKLSLEISCFLRGEDLVSAIGRRQGFDIVFLDVFMGPDNGVAVAKEIRKFDQSCCIIFATNSREHAIDGYGVHALQYLLKPISVKDLAGALDQAIAGLLQKERRCIQVQNRQGNYRIYLNDIVFAESNARVVTIHTRGQGDISVYDRLDNFERQCDDERFLRCHKSFLVNLDNVRAIVNNSVIMESGESIPISMSGAEAKAIFAAHVARGI